ncbi:hypothetical protein YC2023_064507 [Brassica napus]
MMDEIKDLVGPSVWYCIIFYVYFQRDCGKIILVIFLSTDETTITNTKAPSASEAFPEPHKQ